MNKTNAVIDTQDWWSEEYGFFGSHYMDGDNSQDGYLVDLRQTLAQRTETEVSGVIRLLGLRGRERILDLPTGYGRHSISLARRGFAVTGIDLNGVHLGQAVKNAARAGVTAEFCKGNMLELDRPNEFDAVINMFYSFGFFATDEENRRVLENFHRALKPGGKFLFHTDVNVPRIAAGTYKEDETRRLVSGNTLRIVDRYDPVSKRIEGVWIILDRDGRETAKSYSVRVYTREEFTDLCAEVGFSRIETFGDWQGSAYSEDCEDMMVVATK